MDRWLKVTYGVGRAVLGSLAVLDVDIAVIGVEPVGADINNKSNNNDKMMMKKNVVRLSFRGKGEA